MAKFDCDNAIQIIDFINEVSTVYRHFDHLYGFVTPADWRKVCGCRIEDAIPPFVKLYERKDVTNLYEPAFLYFHNNPNRRKCLAIDITEATIFLTRAAIGHEYSFDSN